MPELRLLIAFMFAVIATSIMYFQEIFLE
jgi:hypothetical protein